jgi:hypothetical protein
MRMHMPDGPCTGYNRSILRASPVHRAGDGKPDERGTPAALRPLVSAQQQHVSAAILATDSAPLAGSRGKDQRSQPALKLAEVSGGRLGLLEILVGEVIARLDPPAVDPPLREVVARCNAALEDHLEAERAVGPCDADDPIAAARDELSRLLRLLRLVEPADAALVVRAIRRVLGRFDVRPV